MGAIESGEHVRMFKVCWAQTFLNNSYTESDSTLFYTWPISYSPLVIMAAEGVKPHLNPILKTSKL